MKRYVNLLVLAVAAIMIFTCSFGLAANKYKYTIGFTIGHMGHPFHQRVWRSAVERGNQLGIKVLVLDDKEWDLSVEASNVDQLLSRKVDGILMMGASADGSVASAKRVVDAGIPLVTCLDDITGFRYVGSNFTQGGGAGLIGEALVKKLGGKGNVVYIRGSAGAGVERTRDQGFREAIAKAPDIKIVFENHGNWQRDAGTNLMEAALARFPKKGSINAVFAHNDEMALGALEAIKRADRVNDPIYIFSIDGSPDFCEHLLIGDVTMTAFQNGELIGARGVEVMYKLLKKEKVPTHVPIPWVGITKDNAQSFLDIYNESTGMFAIDPADLWKLR